MYGGTLAVLLQQSAGVAYILQLCINYNVPCSELGWGKLFAQGEHEPAPPHATTSHGMENSIILMS